MKKYIYLLSAALLAFACSVENPYEPELIGDEPEDGPKVTIEFSLPPATKGIMAHNPDISTIHVAVFNKAGVLKQFEQATLTNPEHLTNGDNASGNPKYTVDINMSASKRILHFIADSPITNIEDLARLGGTSGEAAVLNAITTVGTECAYWQRVELDKVDAYTYQGDESYVDVNGMTVNKGDYIKRDGSKILDGTGYFQSQEIAAKLANIAFVRNFAEITVARASTTSNFTPLKFALMNVPGAGYVAPYDPAKSEFVSAYLNPPASGGFTHTMISGSGYPGTMVGNVNTEMPTSFIDLTGDDDARKMAYLYERPVPTTQQPATCIIVGGEFDEPGAVTGTDGLTWFKIEVTSEEGDYFPFYRGVSYLFKIGSITGSNGYKTPEDAYASPAIGDVSSSVATASLEQINDGKGTTLWVEYTDHVATSGGAKTLYYTMYYQATPDDEITYLNGNNISLTVSHPDAGFKAILDQTVTGVAYTGTGAQASLPTPPLTDLQWMVATVNLDGTGDRTKHSVLHVEGTTHAGKKMSRDVNYRVMGTQYFKNGNNVLSATSLVNEESGQHTILSIYLPNDLGLSMFPLVLRIEAQNGHYTTMDGLPVESGPSLFETGKNAFYFLKTIQYSDYYNTSTGVTTTLFQARFKTTRTCDGVNSTNATKFRVLDKIQTERGRTEPYFYTAECSVGVGGPIFTLMQSGVTVKAHETTATLQLRSTTSGTWTLTPSANVTSLTQTYGSGDATVTVTFPENTDENAVKTYTVTASLDAAAAATIAGYTDQVFTITQAEKKNLEPVTRKITTTQSTINESYTYIGEYYKEVDISFENGYGRNGNYITLDYYDTGGITIKANTITSIEITWDRASRTDYSVPKANTTVNEGDCDYSPGTGNNNNVTYPKTTWTGQSDSVTFTFNLQPLTNRPRIRQIEVSYLREAE